MIKKINNSKLLKTNKKFFGLILYFHQLIYGQCRGYYTMIKILNVTAMSAVLAGLAGVLTLLFSITAQVSAMSTRANYVETRLQTFENIHNVYLSRDEYSKDTKDLMRYIDSKFSNLEKIIINHK